MPALETEKQATVDQYTHSRARYSVRINCGDGNEDQVIADGGIIYDENDINKSEARKDDGGVVIVVPTADRLRTILTQMSYSWKLGDPLPTILRNVNNLVTRAEHSQQ